MKGHDLILLASFSLNLLACTYHETPTRDDSLPVMTVLARIDSEAATRTSLSGGKKVIWKEDDKVGVYTDGAENPFPFSLTGGAGSADGVFTGYLIDSPQLALYPFSMAGDADGSSLSLTLPAEQTYVPDSFGDGANPMLGTVRDGQFLFRNICSLLKLSITGRHVVTGIVFETNDPGVKVSGPATVTAGENGVPSLSMGPDASRSVTLVTDGVVLKNDTPTDFYLALPPQTYTGGFTVTINTSSGFMVKSLTSSPKLERSRVHATPAFTLELDGGVSPSAFLAGSGTEEDPFRISSLPDLLLVQGTVNATDGAILSASRTSVPAGTAYYRLLCDIDLSPVCSEESGHQWVPIGNEFSGFFDGGGHQVSNLYIQDASGKYLGFFGNASGATISHLTVSGSVTAKSDAGLVAAKAFHIVDCVARGTLTTVNGGYAGGIVGAGGTIESCINEAVVSGSGNFVGGITGSTSDWLADCINRGPVSNSGQYCGGLVGYQNAGVLFNCINEGTVSGRKTVGGISGYSRQGSKLTNSVNTGSVHANLGYVGGILGYCDAYDFADHDTAVINCINLGDVSVNPGSTDSKYIGGLCGYNYSTIRHCYWLYNTQEGKGIEGGIGIDNGVTNGLFPLSVDQAKGGNYAYPLYISQDGESYSSIVKALNAWAYEDRTSERFPPLKISRQLEYRGWMYAGLGGYPTLSNQSPEKPVADDGSAFFTVNPSQVSVDGKGGSFQVTVYTNLGYQVSSTPDWVEETSIQQSGDNTWVYEYQVGMNPDYSSRSGNIVFCDARGICTPVSVSQEAHPDYYVSTDYSRDGMVEVLQTAKEGNGIDLVLMGDAFSDRQIADGTYSSLMRKIADAFFSEEPYASFRSLFNVYVVFAVSQTEGYDHDGQVFSGYFGDGTKVGGDHQKCIEYAHRAISDSRMDDALIIIAMNSDAYAGTCWMYSGPDGDYGRGLALAFFPLDKSDDGLARVVHHEAGGHGFAKLADEYAYEFMGAMPDEEKEVRRNMVPYGWWKNADFTDDPEQVKWSAFLKDERYTGQGLGCFEGAFTYWTGAWRPTESSIMRNNTGGFNAPSREAIWIRIHKLSYGNSWTYDYEEFVAYDRMNRTSASIARRQRQNADIQGKELKPLSPPVVIRQSWRDTLPGRN